MLYATTLRDNVTQMRQLEAAARAASESQAEATAVQEAMSSEAKRAQASTQFACASGFVVSRHDGVHSGADAASEC